MITQPVGASVVLVDKKTRGLWVNKRGDVNHFPHMWQCAGGMVDQDETPRQALVRELREETGIEASELDFTFLFKKEFEYPNGGGRFTSIHYGLEVDDPPANLEPDKAGPFECYSVRFLRIGPEESLIPSLWYAIHDESVLEFVRGGVFVAGGSVAAPTAPAPKINPVLEGMKFGLGNVIAEEHVPGERPKHYYTGIRYLSLDTPNLDTSSASMVRLHGQWFVRPSVEVALVLASLPIGHGFVSMEEARKLRAALGVLGPFPEEVPSSASPSSEPDDKPKDYLGYKRRSL